MENTKKIYIDLDSILDIRFSLLFNIDKDMLNKIYKNKEYDNRIINEFDYITSNIFNNLYKYRSSALLNISYLTNIFNILILEIGYLKNNKQLLNTNQPIEIDINIYPYKINENKQKDIKDLLSKLLGVTGVIINIINVDTKLLLPKDIDMTYISLIMYDGMEWLSYMLNIEAFRNNYIPNTNLILPALLVNPVVLKKTVDYENMFNDITKQSDMFINLKFTPIKYFNIKTL